MSLLRKGQKIEDLSLRQDAKEWDQEYLEGHWEVLKEPSEYERFNVIIGIIEKYRSSPSILEIGCGEGILQSRLQKSAYSEYLGIDVSEVAIKYAEHLCDAKTNYIIADMECFEADKKYDLVIFNESVYYAVNPINLMSKYGKFLKSGGIMIVSIYNLSFNKVTRKLINKTYKPIQEIITSNKYGKWFCTVYDKNVLEL
jgi:2-polyprenyl-3-methyl-5-hydroxy-6-metoxy-1,4-benzoquinol methylase